jgi:hypothetical protein
MDRWLTDCGIGRRGLIGNASKRVPTNGRGHQDQEFNLGSFHLLSILSN